MNHQKTLTAYTAAFVDELTRVNIKHAIISPGSRSTPISMLMVKHPDIQVHMNIDERSAAFFGLGLAKATREPVALVCTSGTAAANYYPAIIEAHYSRVPLVVITADRPHELREVGAPQAIDQIHLYGKYVKWFSDMSIPEMEDSSIQYVRNIAKRASFTARNSPSGPVHLNFPVREPLVPIMDSDFFQIGRGERIFESNFESGRATASIEAIKQITKEVKSHKKGIIICGEIHDESFANAVNKLSEKLQYPILADPLSQLRTESSSPAVIDCYDTFLRVEEVVQTYQPELIIRFGTMPVSKALTLFIKRSKESPHIVVDGGNGWREPTGLATHMVYSDETIFCLQLADQIEEQEQSEWFSNWMLMNTQTKKVLESVQTDTSMNEGKVFAELINLIPSNSFLFVGNSMPIRDCDTFFHSNESKATVMANRGANGIDGIISTALGVSVAGQPTILVLGDLSFYHDMNGLLAAKMLKLNLTIIVINNDGGGIFSFLPQSAEEHYFEELFGTPHGLDFSNAVHMYGGKFARAENWEQFRSACKQAFTSEGLNVIEVVTQRQENVELHRNLMNDVSQEIILSLTGENNES